MHHRESNMIVYNDDQVPILLKINENASISLQFSISTKLMDLGVLKTAVVAEHGVIEIAGATWVNIDNSFGSSVSELEVYWAQMSNRGYLREASIESLLSRSPKGYQFDDDRSNSQSYANVFLLMMQRINPDAPSPCQTRRQLSPWMLTATASSLSFLVKNNLFHAPFREKQRQ